MSSNHNKSLHLTSRQEGEEPRLISLGHCISRRAGLRCDCLINAGVSLLGAMHMQRGTLLDRWMEMHAPFSDGVGACGYGV